MLKKLGDGLMALFGYPRAQENDAERALGAALAIQRALADLNAGNTAVGAPEFAARVGLDCGPVVVDSTGEVFGEVPNVAARVQAAPNREPLVARRGTKAGRGPLCRRGQGRARAQGRSGTVGLYRIVRASGGRRAGARTPTRLVGREGELDLLGRRWERARKGEGQLALVVGEPGIGKSRLIKEFRARLGETPHTFVEWSSSQLLQNTPLHPIAEWGRQRSAARVRRTTSHRTRSTLGSIGLHPAEYAPLIAPLVDVPLRRPHGENSRPKNCGAGNWRRSSPGFSPARARKPSSLAFEDLHWADPTTLDLMGALAERGAQAPLFIIATARPEFRSPWSLRPHHSVIALAPLDRAQVARMVGEISSRQALSEEVVEGVSERTGGVPLFVEEVTRLLLERGTEGGTQAIPRPCSSRSRRGSTGSAKRARSRGSARFWGAIFLMRCSALSPGPL